MILEDVIDWMYPLQMISALQSPVLSLPIGLSKNHLPIGMQMIAAPFQEKKLIAYSACYEMAHPWHLQVPINPKSVAHKKVA